MVNAKATHCVEYQGILAAAPTSWVSAVTFHVSSEPHQGLKQSVFFCLLKAEIMRCIFGELFGGEK